ncbi:hypothetical protein J6590_073008 [Homalodisca vitripennis]|nr:hypothetical protein J6590_073008 [Homalodisca vitripennis]
MFLQKLSRFVLPDEGVSNQTRTFFHCSHWERPRHEATCTVGALSLDFVCKVMLEGLDLSSSKARLVRALKA